MFRGCGPTMTIPTLKIRLYTIKQKFKIKLHSANNKGPPCLHRVKVKINLPFAWNEVYVGLELHSLS